MAAVAFHWDNKRNRWVKLLNFVYLSLLRTFFILFFVLLPIDILCNALLDHQQLQTVYVNQMKTFWWNQWHWLCFQYSRQLFVMLQIMFHNIISYLFSLYSILYGALHLNLRYKWLKIATSVYCIFCGIYIYISLSINIYICIYIYIYHWRVKFDKKHDSYNAQFALCSVWLLSWKNEGLPRWYQSNHMINPLPPKWSLVWNTSLWNFTNSRSVSLLLIHIFLVFFLQTTLKLQTAKIALCLYFFFEGKMFWFRNQVVFVFLTQNETEYTHNHVRSRL